MTSSIIEHEDDSWFSDTDMTDENDDYSYHVHEGESLDTRVCDCCGRPSRTINGHLNRVYGELFGEVAATYRIQSSVSHSRDASAFIDIVIMPPGSQSTSIREDTIMISFSCAMATKEGIGKDLEEPPFFRIADASKRPDAERAEEALQPYQVTKDLREHAMELLMEIWDLDCRIDELREVSTVETASTSSSLTVDMQA